MTLRQALDILDTALPNTCTLAEKCRWLTELDRLVWVLILHRDGEFAGYSPETDPETALLVGPPFDEIYRYRLEGQIHYQNGEAVRCNNANAMFRAAWQRLSDHHLRSHTPPGKTFRF